jgi:hypothetical protein
MRIHTDLMDQSALRDALANSGLTGEGVYIKAITVHGSRKRARAYELTLRAEEGGDRHGKKRRWPNGGSYGADAGYRKAATYDEWGYFIDAIFDIDPEAIVGPYADRDALRRNWQPRVAA